MPAIARDQLLRLPINHPWDTPEPTAAAGGTRRAVGAQRLVDIAPRVITIQADSAQPALPGNLPILVEMVVDIAPAVSGAADELDTGN